MKRYFFIIILVFSCLSTNASEGYTAKNATATIDAFNKNFYNPSMKLYSTTSDGKGRAAIWTQAIYWDMIMNAYKRTGSKKYYNMIEEIYQGGYEQYDKYNWDNDVEWFIYDDIMWWVISLARAYEITKDTKYLTLSESGFKRVLEGSAKVGDSGSYDSQFGGGMFWAWNQKNPSEAKTANSGKMACINYPTVVAAMALYKITKNEDYLNKAKEIYQWSYDNLFNNVNGRVADSRHGKTEPDWTSNLYNQATCIGAAVSLYKETGDKAYLDDAVLAADYSKNEMSDKNGILLYKNGIEQGIYTAIFSQYIIQLIEDCKQEQYLSWMRLNINTAWKNRDTSRNLTFKDANNPCPKGIIEVYDASGCPALMQVIPSGKKK